VKKNCIAIIPARGGSKRIPKKNIKKFCGKPLITYSIEIALNSNLFEKVVVSTDDEAIERVAKKYGSEVLKRPKELADDFTGTGEVTKHALSIYTGYEFACTIYATAPFLQEKYLKEGLEELIKNKDAVMSFGVTTFDYPIWRSFKITKNNRCEMFWRENFPKRSQDLEEAYHDAGQFYWERVGAKKNDIAFGRESIPIKIPRYLVQDIDTMEDWVRAEMMYKSLNKDSFDEWNEVKKELNQKKESFGFRERDILFLSVGKNIGFEVYGKDKEFLRPVLVLKKYGKYSFLGIPLSRQYKEGKFYYNFSYKMGIISTALLTQSRVFDIKRAKYRSGTIKKDDFKNLWKKYLHIITPSSEEEGSA